MSALLNLELERGDVQVVVLPLRRQAKHSQFALRRQRTFQFVERANVPRFSSSKSIPSRIRPTYNKQTAVLLTSCS